MLLPPLVIGDNKQWKGRTGQEGMWGGGGGIIYWETAYPSFLIVLVWLGFYLPFPPLSSFIHFILLCCCCKALLYFSCVILWLDLGLCCCLSQFVHFVWQQKGERKKFPGFSVKFSTRVVFRWMGLVESGLHLWPIFYWIGHVILTRPYSISGESFFQSFLFRMMGIWKRLRSNFLKGSSTWKPDG